MAGPRLQNRKVGFSWQVQYFVTFVLFLCGRATTSESYGWIFVAGAVLCNFRVVFAWQGHDFRIVRWSTAGLLTGVTCGTHIIFDVL